MYILAALIPLLPLSLAFTAPDVHARSRNRLSHRDVLDKRQGFGGRATFYDVGLGACGSYNGPADFIVALNSAQFGGGYPGPNCGRALTISFGGKTTTAVVMDQCPTCGYGDLDFSRGLFNFFASEDVGAFQMSWSWADSPAAPPPPPPAPSTSHTPEPTTPPPPPPPSSTSTSTAAPTTPSPSPSSTSTTMSTSTSTSSSSITSTAHSSSASVSTSASRSAHSSFSSVDDVVSASIAPSATGTAGDVQVGTVEGAGVLVLLNQAVANMGRVVVVGAQI